MITHADPLVQDKRGRSPGFAAALAFFVAGVVVGLGIASDLGGEFVAGLIILAVLSFCLSVLSRMAENTRKRVTAGEASYRAFFDHAVEGIFRTTAEGHYLAVNQALCDIYGYSDPVTLITGLTDISAQLYVESRRRDEFRTLMQANDVVTNFVSEIYHRSGKRIWISENARAVRDWSGQLLCYEGTVEDVTEKFEQDCALRAALRQAEIANKMKAAFLAAMSHELKTPLNAVLGFSEIIRDEVLGPVGHDAYREYAGDIHKSGARLLSVINDVLDVSRLEGGLLTIEARPENVLDVGETAIKLARAITHDGRRIEIDVPDDMPSLLVDPRRLSQAIGNLLANALKFTPQNGTVRFGARQTADGGAVLTVEDTGIGMEQETIAAALEPFRQIDGSLARRFEGAGLGLSISKALAELHGGSLGVTSAVGEGTIVTITLPASCLGARPGVAAPAAKVA
ncbi:MAG TPA: PAS domain-containing sensor histidine kinase [Rhizomicrobium sp.]|jgi:PAS domain S-box-containing protein|nr:PAS domain-containing sensor histidine kinase [Rhizomicrobium sp.]